MKPFKLQSENPAEWAESDKNLSLDLVKLNYVFCRKIYISFACFSFYEYVYEIYKWI